MENEMLLRDIIAKANKELGITLPKAYIDLTEDGIFAKLYEYYDVYYLDINMIDLDKVPSAIGATKIFRKNEMIPNVDSIAFLNMDGYIYYLNTMNCNLYRSTCQKNQFVSNTFAEWIYINLLGSSVEYKGG